jgi:hypothetical protein
MTVISYTLVPRVIFYEDYYNLVIHGAKVHILNDRFRVTINLVGTLSPPLTRLILVWYPPPINSLLPTVGKTNRGWDRS